MRISKLATTVFLILILSLNGCVTLEKYNYELKSTSIDLSKFEKQGVFITTGDLSRQYKSLSIIVASCYHGITPKADYQQKTKSDPEKKQEFDNVYSTSTSSVGNAKNYSFKECTLDDLLTEITSQAKNKGANGIIKLEIKNISRPRSSDNTLQYGLEVTGLAINIKE